MKGDADCGKNIVQKQGVDHKKGLDQIKEYIHWMYESYGYI